MSRTRWTACLGAAVFTLASVLIAAANDAAAGEPLTVVVNNAGDLGVGGCTKDECTFREAIDLSNGSPGKTIRFDPAVFPPDDETDVILFSPPPKIYSENGITIDGSGAGEVIVGYESAEGGSALNFTPDLGETLRDVIVRDVAISAWVDHGIRICPGEVADQCTFNASNIEISGVTIRETEDSAVWIRGVEVTGLVIDGLTVDTVYDSGSAGVSIFLQGDAEDVTVSNSSVTNTYFGFALEAASLTNVDIDGNGVMMASALALNMVGAMTDVMVSENHFVDTNGMWLTGAPPMSESVTVESNTITDSTGYGMFMTFWDIRGLLAEDNVITGSIYAGMQVQTADGGTLARIRRNQLTGNGRSGLGGDGLRVVGVPALISRNQITENGSLGIDLFTDTDPPNGVTLNDVGDGDFFRDNPLVNFPVIQNSDPQTVRGTACSRCIIELFRSDDDPSGYGEGAEFLAEAVTNPTGQFSVPICGLSLMAGTSVTATATVPNGSTSEFSLNFELEDDAEVCPSPTPGTSPTPTGTPTATPSAPTPSATPGGATPTPTGAPGDHAMGDNDCDGDVDSVDALVLLRFIAQLPVSQQPECPELGQGLASAGPARLFGDNDCDGDVDAVDALRILRRVAALPVSEPKGCPAIGSQQ